MSRMLQALKNLEARSARPAAGPSMLANLPPEANESPSAGAAASDVPSSPAASVCLQSSAIIESLAELDQPQEIYSPPVISLPLPGPAAPHVAALARPAAKAPLVSDRPATALEKECRRMLLSAARSQPYREAAARIRQDLPAGAPASAALVGFGEMSPTHELALSLAAVFGETAPTALIDANLARGTLTRELDRRSAAGLSEFLAGRQAEIEPLLTALENVALVPCGTVAEKVTDVPDDRFAALLSRLAESNAMVLADAGRVDDRAAPAIARLCDAAYFVIRLGAVDAAAAERALKDYRAAGARVLGCIALG